MHVIFSSASSSSSPSSSSSRKDGRPATDNLVFYRVTSWLWYWVFHMGTKLGDETYYSIFFTIWSIESPSFIKLNV